MPLPDEAALGRVLDEVTKGYVPWSISNRTPCAPSKRIFFPRRFASLRVLEVLSTYFNICFLYESISSLISCSVNNSEFNPANIMLW